MIPVKLTLKGLYSYQQQQIIDFTRLTAPHLFGIFGAVGSGKSTILEALSFSLYEETERLSKKNRNYNMMNLKSDDLYIEFICKIGKDNQLYRFTVEGKRNSRHFERINTFNRKAYHKLEEKWLPIDKDATEELIGLSYENFKRTIIIPQGRFQEFLELKDAGRIRMLKELFNLDKYELYDKVSPLEKKNNEKISNIEGQLLQLDETSPEKIISEKKVLKKIEKDAAQLSKDIQKKNIKEQELKKLKELFEKIEEQKLILKNLRNKEPSYKKIESDIDEFQYCESHFKSLIDKKKSEIHRIETADIALKSNREQFDKIKSNLDEEEIRFNNLKKDFENRNVLKQQSDDLKIIIEAKGKQQIILKLDKHIERFEKDLHKLEVKVKQLQKVRKNKSDALKNKKKYRPDTKVITKVINWYNNQESLLEKIKRLEDEETKIKNNVQTLDSEKVSNIPEELLDLILGKVETKKIDEITSELEQGKKDIEKNIIEIDHEIEHLLIQKKTEEFAENLVDGEPCPLCGSKKHPDVISIENVDKKLNKVRQEQSVSSEKLSAINETLQNLKIISGKKDSYNDQLKNIRSNMNTDKKDLKKHQAEFIWTDYNPEDRTKAEKDLNQMNQLDDEIIWEEDEFGKMQDELESEIREKNNIDQNLGKKKIERTKLDSEMETLLRQLKHCTYDDYIESLQEELTEEIEELTTKAEQVEKKYEESDKKLMELRTKKDTLRGTIKQSEQTINGYRKALDKITQDLNIRIDKSKYSEIAEIESILTKDMDINEKKKEISQFKQQLHTALDRCNELDKKTINREYDEDLHKQLIQDLKNKNIQLEELNMKRGKQESIIRNLVDSLEERTKLEKELSSLNLRKEDINTLKSLFKGAGFVNYVSTVYLQNLCRVANKRFYQLSRKQLQLEISENNDFEIRDFLNEGKVRSIKTLSGGQMFQASLSLALALAESIQQFHQSKNNFFFLDEGFGSLDKESLHIVFDTLKSLQKENRIVGIISHVEDLQQEIDTFLHITNDEEKGSIIKTSWE